MGKKKSTNFEGSKRDRFTLTHQMDEALVEAFYGQYVEGNKVDGSFTTKSYENIVADLTNRLGQGIDKDKVKNRLKSIKTNFNECYDVFKNGLSRFAWSPITKLFYAEEEVWQKLIQANPKAEKWRTTQVYNYGKLIEIFGKDRATGKGAETAKEKRKRWAIEDIEEVETIDGIDQLLRQNKDILKNFGDANDIDDGMKSPITNHGKSSQGNSRKGKKKKFSNMEEDDVEI